MRRWIGILMMVALVTAPIQLFVIITATIQLIQTGDLSANIYIAGSLLAIAQSIAIPLMKYATEELRRTRRR